MVEVLERIEGYSNRHSTRFLELNSCGKQYLSDRNYDRIREHGRLDYHILYITAGYCYAEFDGEMHTIAPGNMLIYRPFEPQRYFFKKGEGSVSSYVHFSGTECERIFREIGFDKCNIAYVGLSSRLEGIFQKMEDEYIQMRKFSDDLLAGLLLQYLSTAGRFYQEYQHNSEIGFVNSMDKICNYIYSHYDQTQPIEFYAKMCHLSVDRFSHAFKEIVGVSPKAYILNVKTSIAKGLLESTSLSIQDIAESVGIEDLSYFSRLMKKYTDHPPSYYRK